MENYLDLINDYLKKRNDLMCFNSYSNDVRLFKACNGTMGTDSPVSGI